MTGSRVCATIPSLLLIISFPDCFVCGLDLHSFAWSNAPALRARHFAWNTTVEALMGEHGSRSARVCPRKSHLAFSLCRDGLGFVAFTIS
ncbi:hypothetical protein BDV32DRAFT_111280 [Aspergillus pseudonomiae]|nr:hypothetical protein BDV32DRAFT_111280 [Aspergillus pseudonomiae]